MKPAIEERRSFECYRFQRGRWTYCYAFSVPVKFPTWLRAYLWAAWFYHSPFLWVVVAK